MGKFVQCDGVGWVVNGKKWQRRTLRVRRGEQLGHDECELDLLLLRIPRPAPPLTVTRVRLYSTVGLPRTYSTLQRCLPASRSLTLKFTYCDESQLLWTDGTSCACRLMQSTRFPRSLNNCTFYTTCSPCRLLPSDMPLSATRRREPCLRGTRFSTSMAPLFLHFYVPRSCLRLIKNTLLSPAACLI